MSAVTGTENKMKAGRILFAVAALAAISLLVPAPARAQEWMSTVRYEISFPVGDLKDFTEQTASLRGFGFDVRKFIGGPRSKLSVGGGVGWTVFKGDLGVQTVTIRDAEIDETGETINGDITGLHRRFVNVLPIMGTIHYYLGGSASRARVAVGTQVGITWLEQRAEVGLTAFTKGSWHFGLAPEVAATIPLRDRIFAYVGARWNIAVGVTSLAGEDATLHYPSVNFGLAFYHGFF